MTGGALSSLRLLPRIAVLGAGHTGPVIARVAVEAGYQVSITASGDPEKIELITKVPAPGAEPRWAADAVKDADIVVLAIPLHKFAAFDPSLVAGKLVVEGLLHARGRVTRGALRRVARNRRPEDRSKSHRARRDPLRLEIRHGRPRA